MFSDKRIINALNESFVPVAIDINYVIHQDDEEGEFFRHIAEQGHYAGRTKPTATRQGLYISGADGELVDSLNSTRANTVLKLINRGLKNWETQKGSTRSKFRETFSADERFAAKFPEGGMIWRQTMRDLPVASGRNRDLKRHNYDHAWLSKSEKEDFFPKLLQRGHSWELDNKTLERIAAFHMIDQVRGESWPFTREQVNNAQWSAEVVGVDSGKATVLIKGFASCSRPPSGRRNPYNGRVVDEDMRTDLKVVGWMVFDSVEREIKSLELLAAGQRSGADEYNFRWDDLGPAPIGFAFTMVEDSPENRIRPKFSAVHGYFPE